MADTVQYKCPNCTGALEFNAAKQKLVCPYCGSEYDVAMFGKQDEQIAGATQQQPAQAPDQLNGANFNGAINNNGGTQWAPGEEESMRVWSCPSCGGAIVGDANTAATTCPYCGNRTVMSGALSGTLKPDLIIPFKLDKKAAMSAYEQHIKGKRLIPGPFKAKHKIEEIKPIYLPFWLFDANVSGEVDYIGTRTRSWSDSNYDYVETSEFRIKRVGGAMFERIPADGSRRTDDTLMECIEPFDYREAREFSGAYLAGYVADKYDVGAEELSQRVHERLRTSMENAFGSTVTGYSSVRAVGSNINIMDSGAKYALLPVWMLTTTYQGKNYVFAMNGQTGKFSGDLPFDKGAYKKWFAGICAGVAAAVAGAGMLIAYLFM